MKRPPMRAHNALFCACFRCCRPGPYRLRGELSGRPPLISVFHRVGEQRQEYAHTLPPRGTDGEA